MTFHEILDAIGDTVAWTIAFPIIAFLIAYPLGSPWRAHPLGIEREFKTLWLLLLWMVIMAGNFLPDELETFRLVARIVVFGLVATALTIQFLNLRRVQTNSKRPLFFTWLTYRAQEKRRADREARKAASKRERLRVGE